MIQQRSAHLDKPTLAVQAVWKSGLSISTQLPAIRKVKSTVTCADAKAINPNKHCKKQKKRKKIQLVTGNKGLRSSK